MRAVEELLHSEQLETDAAPVASTRGTEKSMQFRLGLLIGLASLCTAADLGSGLEKFKARDYAGAESELRAVVAAEPENVEALRVLGLALERQGKNQDALPFLEKAAQTAPDSAAVKLAQAGAYAGEKQYDKASELVEAAAAQQGDNPELPYYRGMLAVLKKQHKEAVPLLETAIRQDPDNAYAHYYAGLAYSSTKRPDKMVEAFSNFLRLEPKAPEAAKVRSFLRSSR
jgi:tetratricopeptide (TPR) repeat protein